MALRIQSRLRRLETRLSDGSGLRPRSPEWLEHWARRLNAILRGEEAGLPGCIPLDVWDAIGTADAAEGVPESARCLAQMAAVRSEDS